MTTATVSDTMPGYRHRTALDRRALARLSGAQGQYQSGDRRGDRPLRARRGGRGTRRRRRRSGTFRETNWKSDRALRSRVLHEMAERFEARAADLIQLLSTETGKVVPDATFEVGHGRATLLRRACVHRVWPGCRVGARTLLAPRS